MLKEEKILVVRDRTLNLLFNSSTSQSFVTELHLGGTICYHVNMMEVYNAHYHTHSLFLRGPYQIHILITTWLSHSLSSLCSPIFISRYSHYYLFLIKRLHGNMIQIKENLVYSLSFSMVVVTNGKCWW
jgi:hypothetical protein